MAEERKKKSFLNRLFKTLLNGIVFFACFIVVVLLFYVFMAQIHSNDEHYKPLFSFYTIVSPSMNPVIKVYDVVVNVRVSNPEQIEVGDIITYVSTNPTSLGMTITHRVVAVYKGENGVYEYQTQGDNNSESDSVLVTFDNIIGKEIFIIPALGKIQFVLADKKGWIFLLLIPIAIFIFKDVYELIELLGLRRKVDKVTGYVEEPERVVKIEKEKERKEIIRRELIISEVKADALIRAEAEEPGFLEPYSEDYVAIGKVEETPKEDKKQDVNAIKIVKPDVIEGEKIETSLEDETIKEGIKELEPVISHIEILDTDELTHKIKMYDEKLLKLDKMLRDLENMKDKKKKEQLEVVEIPKEEVVPEVEEVKVTNEIIPEVEEIKEVEEEVPVVEEIKEEKEEVPVVEEIVETKEEEPKEEIVEEIKEEIIPKQEVIEVPENIKIEEVKEIPQVEEEKEVIIPKVEKITEDVDDYLIGRLKVVNIEVAQKKRGRKKKVIVDDEILLKTSILPQINELLNDDSKTKETKDTKEDKRIVNYEIKDKKLNLKKNKKDKLNEDIYANIDELLGVNEDIEEQDEIDDNIIKELNRFYSNEKELVFNPKIVKKVDKSKNEKKGKEKKKGIIIFQKEKK